MRKCPATPTNSNGAKKKEGYQLGIDWFVVFELQMQLLRPIRDCWWTWSGQVRCDVVDRALLSNISSLFCRRCRSSYNFFPGRIAWNGRHEPVQQLHYQFRYTPIPQQLINHFIGYRSFKLIFYLIDGGGGGRVRPWCTLAYWELRQRVGRLFPVTQPSVAIFTDVKAQDGLCLSALTGHRAPETDAVRRTRQKVGLGIFFLTTIRTKDFLKEYLSVNTRITFKIPKSTKSHTISTNFEVIWEKPMKWVTKERKTILLQFIGSSKNFWATLVILKRVFRIGVQKA